MIQRVVIRPLAVEDIAEAVAWYDSQRLGLGDELTEEIIKATRRAQEAPDLFPVLRPRDGMRRVLIERFPYRGFFTVAEEALYVHAVLHGARHDSRWQRRS